jgi:type VI protein secretion system component Hcp
MWYCVMVSRNMEFDAKFESTSSSSHDGSPYDNIAINYRGITVEFRRHAADGEDIAVNPSNGRTARCGALYNTHQQEIT